MISIFALPACGRPAVAFSAPTLPRPTLRPIRCAWSAPSPPDCSRSISVMARSAWAGAGCSNCRTSWASRQPRSVKAISIRVRILSHEGATMIRFDDAATLPLLYHLNSEPWQNTDAYEGTPYEVEYKQFGGAPSTPLPPPSESALRTVLIKCE